jgi:peptidyl-prolyl cis-trans isomerase SurA
MKYIALLLISIFSFQSWSQEDDAVIMTINDEDVTKSEFLQVYLKNNSDPQYDKENLDEYLELYKKFKLKVAEAEALGYDTIPALVRELSGYREQLARPYLVDSSKNDELVKEAYNRMKTEIRASHILIKVPEGANPDDTLKAYEKIMALKKRIEEGGDFGTVAASKNGSEDPSAKQNKGDLGYFTAFQMVYPFESAAYNTNEGEISNPIRTKYGYHIIKVVDKREARGTITTAHIMVTAPKNSGKNELQNAEKKINEIYEKLKNGDSFEKLAQLYSDDQGSKNKGGRLPAFGTGTNQRMVPDFEDVAFALKEDDAISEPFKTDYGYHIIKRINYEPISSFDEQEGELQNKVNRGARGQQTQKSFIKKLKQNNSFKDNGAKRLDWFYTNLDSSIFKGNWEAPTLDKNKWMFKYNDVKYDMQSFLNYIKTSTKSRPTGLKSFVNEKYSSWQNEQIMNDEKSRLEDKYPAYKALLQEYHDGVLLYEIMKDKVWDKAIKDTTGLQKFFETNKDNYMWPERIEATIYSSDKKEMIDTALKLINLDTLSMKEILDSVNKDSQLNIKGEKGKFIQENMSYLKGKDLKEGVNSIYEFEGKHYLVIVEKFLPKGNKSLSEARGAVIQDYQEHLEKEWLSELREKHEITVNEEVLYSIGD